MTPLPHSRICFPDKEALVFTETFPIVLSLCMGRDEGSDFSMEIPPEWKIEPKTAEKSIGNEVHTWYLFKRWCTFGK
jgi:hypothetical protein